MVSSATTADTVANGRLTRQQGRQWTMAIFVIFFICGISIASWLARIPAVRDSLGASTFKMGMLIVGLSVGSMIGLALSSHVIARIGAKRTMYIVLTVMLAGLVVVGLGSIAPSYPLILLGLLMFGLGTSTNDVAMNLSGAANERVMGRTLMPLFHALFSLGTVAGAGLGALAERAHVPVVWHLIAIAVVAMVAALWALPQVQPESLGVSDEEAAQDEVQDGGWRQRLAVWKQPGTLLIGLIVLGMAFAEGSAGDWLALGMVDDRGTSKATGALIYAVFVAAMTVGRVAGVFALDRFGRVPVLRATAVTALLGLALVIFVPFIWAAVIGTVLWGLGASLGFPVGMSAAADDPRNAAARVSAVATIGYLAFLVGPPGLGLLGEHVGLLNALIVVMVLIAAAVFAAPAARERHRVVAPAGTDRAGVAPTGR
ncbi:MFS transporter [Nakamurella lactea]|uniref:MFS transporter n=1 Tax=Nakamurella lactea TaxID=459515 RepID=UPI00040795E3|nr:MFS transporter [Nakamurella lactea]